MLCQFSFENFKSYRDETTFDFQAESLPEFEDTLLKTENGPDLLPLGVLYGPNGGGKSNLLQAFACMTYLVVKPIHGLGKNRQQMIIQSNVKCTPFMLDSESRNQPTIFRVFFLIRERDSRNINKKSKKPAGTSAIKKRAKPETQIPA